MSAPVNEGDILADKYRVDKVLGVGGMGVVVAAHHLQLDEKVALKFLLPEMLSNTEAVGRFEREARAAVKIKSEHVARVSDVGKLENGSPYMVMEYLEGGDLEGWVRERGALPIEQAVEFVLQACEAIAEAHVLGIVHRDLKPANLFCVLRADGIMSIKVLDFGISKVTALGGSGPDFSMTKTQAMMGSPLYMSPEQMRSSRDVDPRADIWALGVILYELLTGKVPFDGEGLPELVLAVVSSQPAPMRALRPEVPAELEAVVLHCLEKDRERRFPDVAELAIALVPFGPERARGSAERVSRIIQKAGMSTSTLTLPSAGTKMPTGGTVGSWGGTAPGAKGSKKALIGTGIAVGVVAMAAAAALALRGSSDVDAGAQVAASAAARAEPAAPASVAPATTGTLAPGASAEIAKAATSDPASAAPASSAPAPVASAASAPTTRGVSGRTPGAAKPVGAAAAPPKTTPSPSPKSPTTPAPGPAAPKYNPLDHL